MVIYNATLHADSAKCDIYAGFLQCQPIKEAGSRKSITVNFNQVTKIFHRDFRTADC